MTHVTDLTADIVTAAAAFVRMTDSRANFAGRGSLCHLFDCVGGLSRTTCDCWWTDLVWAVRRADVAREDAGLASLLGEIGAAKTIEPDHLRQMLHERGWRKDAP